MNILQILNKDIWIHIVKYLKPLDVCQILKTTKVIANIIDGKLLLRYIDFIKVIHGNNINCITDYMVSIILNDVGIHNLNFKKYKATIYDTILLLKYILANDVDKTIFMLKMIGGNDMIYDNNLIYYYFSNEQKKLHYCLTSINNDIFKKQSSSLNLHFAYLIFLTPIDFMMNIIKYMKLNDIMCEFKISYQYMFINDNKKYILENKNLFDDDNICLNEPLHCLEDGFERINLLFTILNKHNNFYIKDKITFDSFMDENYVITHFNNYRFNDYNGYAKDFTTNYIPINVNLGYHDGWINHDEYKDVNNNDITLNEDF